MSISSGLATYAKLKAVIGILLLCCCCCGASYLEYYMFSQNYILANNASIYQAVVDGSACISTQINCSYYIKYTDQNNKSYNKILQVVNNKLPTIGSTTVYYNNKNPDNYTMSPLNPLYISSGVLGLISCLLLLAFVHFYFISKYDSLATVEGGIGATSDIASIFRGR